MLRATASEIDEIAGFAMSAGSSFAFFTRSGTILPRTLAKITINSIALQTVSAIEIS